MDATWIMNALTNTVTIVGSMVQNGATQWMQYNATQWYNMVMMGMQVRQQHDALQQLVDDGYNMMMWYCLVMGAA